MFVVTEKTTRLKAKRRKTDPKMEIIANYASIEIDTENEKGIYDTTTNIKAGTKAENTRN